MMKDLGWQGWGMSDEALEVLTSCRLAGHETQDVKQGLPFQSGEHIVTCPECQYRYHYDTSD